MSKQNVSIEDLQCYSLDDLKKLDSLLDSFFENFRKTTSTGEEKVIRVAYVIIILVLFTSIMVSVLTKKGFILDNLFVLDLWPL